MIRPITILGAPSSIGIRPYDDGTARRLDLAPGALRAHGLASRVGARDAGDVLPPPYRDFVRTPGKPRNESEVAAYSRAIAARVKGAATDDAFVLLLGGDCSVVLGGLLGFHDIGRRRVGLIYVDAHADFATPASSRTGSAASMCLALAVGRGDTQLARLGGGQPLVREADVVLIGRRDDADAPWYGHDELRVSPVLDLPNAVFRNRGPSAIAAAGLAHVTQSGIDGFWIHVDADVLDPAVLPAVDSPEPDGLTLDTLAELLTPLARHPSALGLELTIYDPALDPDRTSAARLTMLLERVLGGARPVISPDAFWEGLARNHA